MSIPYHRSYAEDMVDLTGMPVAVDFDLFPISYVFKKGNRIRVTITCSDQGTYAFPEELFVDPPPTVSIYRDSAHSSHITLPVIPPKPFSYSGPAKVNMKGNRYEGPAELLVYKTAIYLHYGDRWLNWTSCSNWEKGRVEHYKCQGNLGKIEVLVQSNPHAAFDVLANGKGIHFRGEAQ
jgi:hypothetical protein